MDNMSLDYLFRKWNTQLIEPNRDVKALSAASPAAPPPPPPIPTGKGSRSAAGPVLSEYIDKSIHIPELTLPQRVHSLKPLDIDYQLLISMDDDDSTSRLLTSARGMGIFRIIGHGISCDELRSILIDSEQIFGLPIKCCQSYGDHEKFVWCDDDKEFMEKGKIVLGEQKIQIFSQNMENVASKLKAIAEELAKVIASAIDQSREQVHLAESEMNIYRYHRANIIDRIPSLVEETSQVSCLYALKLHLLLESGEFGLQSESHSSSFSTSNDTIVVTMGKELKEGSHGEMKSAGGELLFRPYLNTNRPSFSIEQKWSSCNLNEMQSDSNRRISVANQILILLVLVLLYNTFTTFVYS